MAAYSVPVVAPQSSTNGGALQTALLQWFVSKQVHANSEVRADALAHRRLAHSTSTKDV